METPDDSEYQRESGKREAPPRAHTETCVFAVERSDNPSGGKREGEEPDK